MIDLPVILVTVGFQDGNQLQIANRFDQAVRLVGGVDEDRHSRLGTGDDVGGVVPGTDAAHPDAQGVVDIPLGPEIGISQ